MYMKIIIMFHLFQKAIIKWFIFKFENDYFDELKMTPKTASLRFYSHNKRGLNQ